MNASAMITRLKHVLALNIGCSRQKLSDASFISTNTPTAVLRGNIEQDANAGVAKHYTK